MTNNDEQNVPLFKVVLGTISLKEGKSYSIVKAFTYPSQANNPFLPSMDIGLIKVEREIKFNEMVQPIEISRAPIKKGINAVLSGW